MTNVLARAKKGFMRGSNRWTKEELIDIVRDDFKKEIDKYSRAKFAEADQIIQRGEEFMLMFLLLNGTIDVD